MLFLKVFFVRVCIKWADLRYSMVFSLIKKENVTLETRCRSIRRFKIKLVIEKLERIFYLYFYYRHFSSINDPL